MNDSDYCLNRSVPQLTATVIIGGIISSMFLTLVVLPILYDWVEKHTRKASPSPTRLNAGAEADRERAIA
jgi:hypothetical protein